jgi:Core-2/I-Branching enzyme
LIGVSAPHSEQPRFAYLLLTHKGPAHVEELARRIMDLSPSAHIVVHHDAAASDLPWGGRSSERIHFVERGRVSWGDWSMIEATMRMLRYALDRLDADWFVLVSGEHRPAVDLRQWEASTAASGHDAVLDGERLPERLRFGRADFERNQYLARTRHRWRLLARPRHRVLHRSMGLLMKLSCYARPIVSVEFVHRRDAWAVGRRRRAHPVRRLSFYRGSQWFVLNRRAAKAALAIDPRVADWFTQSWIPDEAYLQTALRQVSDLVIANTPTTFVLDTPPKPYPGWMQLSLEDLPAALESGLPFVRKVDPATRPEVVATIDRAVERRRTGGQDHPSAATAHAPDPLREGRS